MSALDKQVAGKHYKELKIQPIQYITANNLPYIEGNVVKYITRWRHKGGIEDLNKVIHYVELLKELEVGKSERSHRSETSLKDIIKRGPRKLGSYIRKAYERTKAFFRRSKQSKPGYPGSYIF